MTLEAFLSRKPVVTDDRLGRAERVRRRRRERVRARRSRRRFAEAISTARRATRRAPRRSGDAGLRARADHHLGRRDREAGRSERMKAHHPDPVPQRGARRCRRRSPICRRSIPGVDVDRGAGDRRRVARRHGGRRARARRRSHRPAAPQQGTRRRVHGRHRRAPASAAPTSSSTPTPTTSTPAHDIPQLLAPLLARRGRHRASATATSASCSTCRGAKQLLQRLGSWVVRQVSNTTVPDTTSGFRAYTREAALRMTIVVRVLLHARVDHPGRQEADGDRARRRSRPTRARGQSRLFDSMFSYIKRSGATIVRIYAMYEPLKVFTYIGVDRVRRRASAGRCGSSTTTSRLDGCRHIAVADRCRRADDRRLSGRCSSACSPT